MSSDIYTLPALTMKIFILTIDPIMTYMLGKLEQNTSVAK